MDVLFASNEKYVPHLATALVSLLNTNPDISFRIHVLFEHLGEKGQVRLREIIAKSRSSIEFHQVPDSIMSKLKVNHHFSKENYYRLLAPNVIKERVCLYLDCDLLVRGPIDDLLNICLDDHYLAAVEITGFNRHLELGMDESAKYFNSGVMVLNLEMWRQNDLCGRVVNFVDTHPDVIEYVDQCGLNAVINGKWMKLPVEFNLQTHMVSDLREDELRSAKVIHFTGSGKPWLLGSKHPFRGEYWSWRNKTKYATFLSDDFSLFRIAGVYRKKLRRVVRKLTQRQ